MNETRMTACAGALLIWIAANAVWAGRQPIKTEANENE